MKNILFNQSLEKGLKVLSVFGENNRTMNLNEIAEASLISKSSAQRMVHTLVELGFLKKDNKDKKFKLTIKTLKIGYNYLQTNSVIDIANPFLSELSQQTGETVNLTERDELEMVYVSRFVAQKFISIHMPIGSRIPIYCSSVGKAWLSALPEHEAIECLQQSNLKAMTPKTLTNIDTILEELKTARLRGYAINEEELYLSDLAIASPIIYNNKPVASVNVSLPAGRWTLSQAEKKIADYVINCAKSISLSIRSL